MDNSLGSVTEITDDAGAIVENYTYDPYGTPSLTISTINNRYRFTGREYDEESGLYHYRARAYSPTIGRFMQRDPIGVLGGINLYSYVGNHPIDYTDAYGLLDPNGGVCVFGKCTYTKEDFIKGSEDMSKELQKNYPSLSKEKADKMALNIMTAMGLGEAKKMNDLGEMQKKIKDAEKIKDLQKQQEKIVKDICDRIKCDADLTEEEKQPCSPKQE